MEAKQRQADDQQEARKRSDERAMLAAFRRGQESAIEQFHSAYELRLIDIARSLGVARAERQGTVLEFLSVSVESLFASRIVPRSLTAYVTTSFCNFVRDRQRAEITRREREEDACTELGATGERAALDSCSEYSARMASGLEATEARSTARSRFVRAILASLSEQDRELLEYRSKLSLREAADLTQMTYGNAKIRMFRIRAQLVTKAREVARGLPKDDRAELARFLQRSGLLAEGPRNE